MFSVLLIISLCFTLLIKNICVLTDFINQYFSINPETGVADINAVIVVVLILCGFVVGVINTFAGGATVITYSIFMMLGLPASTANGSVRIGVMIQTFASSVTFYRKGKLPLKKGLILSIPILIGTVIGASIAVTLDMEVFEKILGVGFLIMLFFLLNNPNKWIKEQVEKTSEKAKPIHLLLFFLMGMYGGFIHIGVGLFVLATLVSLMGYDLIKANALKIFIVFMYTPAAFIIFLLNGQVDLLYGLIAAIGNMMGGIVAPHLAIKKGNKFISRFLAVIMFVFAMKLLFF